MNKVFSAFWPIRRFFPVLLAILLIFPDGAFSKARKPQVGPVKGSKEKIIWVKNGHQKSLRVNQLNGKDYLQIGEYAKLSRAQLRWQSVTEQACLSRHNGLMCFNWDTDLIFNDGIPVKKKAQLLFKDNQLWVPLSFSTSKSFRSFSQTKISWNKKNRILKQNARVTLSLPPVENMGDHYQVAINMEDRIPYHLIDQGKSRVWLRFVRGRFGKSEILKGDSVIKEIRVSQKRASADLIVNLGPKAKHYNLREDPGGKKLYLDVYTDGKGWPVAAAPMAKKGASKKSPPKKTYKPVTDKRIRTIVIDAGHGGIDSGAVGARRTYEKDINLKVAKTLAKILKKEKNLRVLMTREKDEFVSLGERTRMANEAMADLFVSIHCNAALSSRARGFEVYILSPEASDEAAAAVARLENSVVDLEVEKGDNSSKLESLLASMAVYNFINESSETAAHVCRGVKSKGPVRSTKVKEANFHVLRMAQMPGVLVELEYISNPVTEQKLRSSRYRNSLARGLADGILRYDRLARQKYVPVDQESRLTRREK